MRSGGGHRIASVVVAGIVASLCTAVAPTAASEPVPIEVVGSGTVVPRPDLGPLPVIEAFVDQQFKDFLGRAPSTSERASLAKGLRELRASPEETLESIAHANPTAAQQASIARLYQAFFLRLPDRAGLDFWLRRREAGRTLAWMAASFAGSTEFQARYGRLDDRAFVRLVYGNVLRREPDADGLVYWSRRLGSGTSRGQLMASFSESSEFRRVTQDLVDRVWASTRMLGRMPTREEVGDREPDGFGRIAASVLRGEEYAALHPEQVATANLITPQHDGVQRVGSLPDDLARRWTARFEYEVNSPVIAGGRVFAADGGAGTWGSRGHVWALDIDDGSVLWGPVEIPTSHSRLYLTHGGGAVYAINDDELVVAMDEETGAVLWTRELPLGTTTAAGITYDGGQVFASTCGNGSFLYALDAASGGIQWTGDAGDHFGSPAVAGDEVYVANDGERAFDRWSGEQRWGPTKPAGGCGGRQLVVHEGRVYSRDYPVGSVLDAATGDVLAPFNDIEQSTPTFVGPLRVQRWNESNTFWGPLVAIDETTGVERWRVTTLDRNDVLQTDPVAIGDVVFAGGTWGGVYRFAAADGALEWSDTVDRDEPTDTYPSLIQSLTIGNGLLVAETGNQLVAYG